MTPLDAAQALRSGALTYWDSVPTGTTGRLGPDVGSVLKCLVCRQQLSAHAEDCPASMLPQIVAALEAAERVATIYRECEKWEGQFDHADDEWQALRSLSEVMTGITESDTIATGRES